MLEVDGHDVVEGAIHAVARPLHCGCTTWRWDVEFRDDADRLRATSRVSVAIRSYVEPDVSTNE